MTWEGHEKHSEREIHTELRSEKSKGDQGIDRKIILKLMKHN